MNYNQSILKNLVKSK